MTKLPQVRLGHIEFTGENRVFLFDKYGSKVTMRSVSIDEFLCDKLKYGFVMGDQIMKASANGTLNILTLYIQKQVFFEYSLCWSIQES